MLCYVFVKLGIIGPFAGTNIDDEIFPNFGLLLGERRIVRASVDPPISCSS